MEGWEVIAEKRVCSLHFRPTGLMMNNKSFTGFLAFQDLEVKYNRLGLDIEAVRKEKLASLLQMLQLGKT